MSIHKAQGQTLDKVKINLTRSFEKGMAYVALSRATHLGGIQVIGFDPKKVVMDRNVLEWEQEVNKQEAKMYEENQRASEKRLREMEKKGKEWNEKKARGGDIIEKFGTSRSAIAASTTKRKREEPF